MTAILNFVDVLSLCLDFDGLRERSCVCCVLSSTGRLPQLMPERCLLRVECAIQNLNPTTTCEN